MDIDDERIKYAIKHTEILRLPKQTLSTFGMTNIYYYLVTEPVYSEFTKDVSPNQFTLSLPKMSPRQ